MSKVDVYVGEYLLIDQVNKQESAALASTSSVIGMPVRLEFLAADKSVRVMTPAGDSLGVAHPANKLHLQEALESGWPLHAWLSFVYYDAAASLYKGEIAYLFYNLKPGMQQEKAALEAYAGRVAGLLKSGERPRLSLTGTQYKQVLESEGSWEHPDRVPLPISGRRGSKTVVFKRKMTLADRLAQGILERKPLPIAVSLLLLMLVVAVCVVLISMCTSLVFGA